MPIHYPTTTGSLYTVNSRSMKRKRLDAQVAVKLQGGSEALFGDVGYQNQIEVVQIAAQAAYNGFNRVDQVSGFRGVMSVALSHGPGGIMVDGSSSSGLAYGLSLFLTWWKAKAKPQPALPTIIATGTLSRLGEVTPIEGMAAKLQGTLSFLEQADDETDSVFICHPDNAQAINPETRAELNALHCDIVEATTLGDALKALLSDWYDGDGISEPFKGLDSFEYVDQQRFFGREQDVEALIKALNKSNGSLVVAGASGSGKSSLLKAGVIPTLERTDKGCVATFSTPQDIGEDIESWLKSLPDTSDERHLIIIDQAESLFRGIAGDANEWLDNLQSYLNKHPNTQLIISIRDEFIAALSKHNAFSEMQLFTVPAELSHQQWYTIITKQAEYANLSFEDGLIDELMAVAMERRDNLPLMSFLLQQMHAHSDKHTRTITFKDYEAVGKLEGVIDTQAEKAIRKFDEDTLKQWLPILFQHLIWVNEDDSTTLSRPYEVTEQTPPNINALIQSLYEEKLLKRISKEKPVYQIAHERLMTSWKRIKDWHIKYGAEIIFIENIRGLHKKWLRQNRDKDYLLKDIKTLRDLGEVLKDEEFKTRLERNNLMEYVEASLNKKSKEKRLKIFERISIVLIVIAMSYSLFVLKNNVDIKNEKIVQSEGYLKEQKEKNDKRIEYLLVKNIKESELSKDFLATYGLIKLYEENVKEPYVKSNIDKYLKSIVVAEYPVKAFISNDEKILLIKTNNMGRICTLLDGYCKEFEREKVINELKSLGYVHDEIGIDNLVFREDEKKSNCSNKSYTYRLYCDELYEVHAIDNSKIVIIDIKRDKEVVRKINDVDAVTAAAINKKAGILYLGLRGGHLISYKIDEIMNFNENLVRYKIEMKSEYVPVSIKITQNDNYLQIKYRNGNSHIMFAERGAAISYTKTKSTSGNGEYMFKYNNDYHIKLESYNEEYNNGWSFRGAKVKFTSLINDQRVIKSAYNELHFDYELSEEQQFVTYINDEVLSRYSLGSVYSSTLDISCGINNIILMEYKTFTCTDRFQFVTDMHEFYSTNRSINEYNRHRFIFEYYDGRPMINYGEYDLYIFGVKKNSLHNERGVFFIDHNGNYGTLDRENKTLNIGEEKLTDISLLYNGGRKVDPQDIIVSKDRKFLVQLTKNPIIYRIDNGKLILYKVINNDDSDYLTGSISDYHERNASINRRVYFGTKNNNVLLVIQNDEYVSLFSIDTYFNRLSSSKVYFKYKSNNRFRIWRDAEKFSIDNGEEVLDVYFGIRNRIEEFVEPNFSSVSSLYKSIVENELGNYDG